MYNFKYFNYNDFLLNNPLMSVCPTKTKNLVLKGSFKLDAKYRNLAHIIDYYKIKIVIYYNFPTILPKVFEIENKIPHKDSFHINPDNSLCLASPLRILMFLKENHDLQMYVNKFLVPFLYDTSNMLNNNYSKRLFGKLSHGKNGLIEDYKEIFNLKKKEQVIKIFDLLTLPRGLADEKVCPCGCNNKLKNCNTRVKINEFRNYADEIWYKNQLKYLKEGI